MSFLDSVLDPTGSVPGADVGALPSRQKRAITKAQADLDAHLNTIQEPEPGVVAKAVGAVGVNGVRVGTTVAGIAAGHYFTKGKHKRRNAVIGGALGLLASWAATRD